MKRSFTLFLWVLFLAAFVGHAIAQQLWFPPIGHDPLMRYAPMADAFARGDWFTAFHPRSGLIFQLIAGSIAWLAGVKGSLAIQFAATFGYTLSVVPLGAFFRRLYDERVAFWSVLVYLCVSDYMSLAGFAYRDDLRVLGMALLALGAIMILRPRAGAAHEGFYGALWFALGEVLLITLKVDCVAIASLAAGALGLVLLVRRQWGLILILAFGWLLGVLMMCTLVYAYTGWFIPVAPHYLEGLK